MVSKTQLEAWKAEWRELLVRELSKAMKSIEERLPDDVPKAHVLVQLRAQLNDANREKLMGTRSADELSRAYNQLRSSLLLFIDELEPEDFLPRPAAGFRPKARRGTLLHKIPAEMQVGREEECIIRLAYDRSVIADNLELTDDVEVKEVTVSKVMEAELIDPSPEPAFAIRTFYDERQFLQEGEYTEWKFYVRPLREGTFSLLLKLTVIEEIDGERERRNITWEEQVQIVTEAPQSVPAGFTEAGLSLNFGSGGSRSGAAPAEPAMEAIKRGYAYQEPVPASPAAPAAQPQRPAPPKKKSGGMARRLSIAASVALALGLGTWWLGSGSSSVEQVTEPLDKNVGTPAEESPDRDTGGDQGWPGDGVDEPGAEQQAWQRARNAGTREALQEFLEAYPKSLYAPEARRMLQQLERQ